MTMPFRTKAKRTLRPGRVATLPLFLVAALASVSAHAQSTGIAQKALPNVLLLVDTSGSMERMFDNSMPSANRRTYSDGTALPGLSATLNNACTPGTETNPNRWGSLLQALTGNFQPFYSCAAIARQGANTQFKNEFGLTIGGTPYNPADTDYNLPYHRPLAGSGAGACALAGVRLAGVANGTNIGSGKLGAGGDATDFPSNAFASYTYASLSGVYAAGGNIIGSGTTCDFNQARDGQIDAARDYVRFGLMTFDNDVSPGIGVSTASPVGGSVSANPFLGTWSYIAGTSASGNPAGCSSTLPWEVGARHNAAPPWEGRMIAFPDGNATLFDVQRNNDLVQQVLLGSRPYGATPIDGMMKDAFDYLTSGTAPLGPANTSTGDLYVRNGCRDQFVVLLTDGAPNLDMRPGCKDAAPAPSGVCPFSKTSAEVADALYKTNPSIPVYVIGFSVNGENPASDGFPSPPPASGGWPENERNCREWLKKEGGATQLATACTSSPRPAGSTAEACCKLNDIALAGSGGERGAYFAESQSDLVLAFGRVLGGITREASTRTVPALSPAVNFTAAASGTKIRSGQFVASFIPSPQRVWSGEIDRVRTYCTGATPTVQTQSVTNGDSYAANLAAQSGGKNRTFFTATPPSSTQYDSSGSMTPYAAASNYSDGISMQTATEVVEKPGGSRFDGITDWAKMLGIDGNTCKRTRVAKLGGGIEVFPALTTASNCADVVWAFASARAEAVTYSGKDFNVRCTASAGSGDANTGVCSVSGDSCTMNGSTKCTTKGDVCVPKCAALGAVFRSNPVVVGPPDALVREDGYRAFAQARANRRPTMFVATTDGILHAFKALSAPDISLKEGSNYELWGFVPPAVLPSLAANYPTGQQILFDGSPVVKDVVWNRAPNATSAAADWKTTLVGGLGFGGGGYFALNVTDVDCGGTANEDACKTASAATSWTDASAANKGPHFLWQLTDLDCSGACAAADDKAKRTRTGPDGKKKVALFGTQSATPAITMVQAKLGSDSSARQYGVAILPGGMDGAPAANANGCERAINSAADKTKFEAFDATPGRRDYVRQWAASCSDPVAGRSVTVVRVDTGEIIRHFGRSTEAPGLIVTKNLLTDTPLDSPMIGAPAVFPNVPGTPAQKAFLGDADGTVWRLDLTDPDPSKWAMKIFHDTGYPAKGTRANEVAASRPLTIPLTLSVGLSGDPVVNVATGDQENITVSTDLNWVGSVTDKSTTGKAVLNWQRKFTDGERVTGPMAVFDRVLYYATYKPKAPAAATCNQAGEPSLWGVDYITAADTSDLTKGGSPRWCKRDGSGNSSVDASTGACKGTVVEGETVGASYGYTVVPGVSVTTSLACADVDTSGDPAFTGMSASEYRLTFGATAKGTGGNASAVQQSERVSLRIARPRMPARLDAWALVTDP